MGLEQLFSVIYDVSEDIIVSDTQTALKKHPELHDCVANFNSSLTGNGLFIYVPDGVQLKEPVKINLRTATAVAENMHHIIYLGKDAKLSLVQEWFSEHDQQQQTKSITHIYLAENASLQKIKFQNEHTAVQHHAEYSVTQSAHSQLHTRLYSLGGAISREIWQIVLQGEYASATCHGLVIATGNQQMHQQLNIQHAAPHCRSEQQFKAIATDTARAMFTGKVVVQKAGGGADARQHSHNLLLSTRAEVGTRPELEVYTDDVKASHGATVGQLDAEALFFLRARGIPLAHAQQMLLQAFVETKLENLSSDLHAWLAPYVAEKLLTVRQYE